MKYTFLFVILLTFGLSSCSEDPCETPNNVECETQDFDNDGVLNGVDDAPEDKCSPNFPSFDELVIGTWEWSLFGTTGIIEIKEDGTYEDIENEIISNGEVTSRSWSIELFTSLKMEVKNATGLGAGLTLKSETRECDKIIFDGQDFGNIVFTRQ